MLNLKPLLTVQEGRVEGVEKVRTQKKALQRALEIVEEEVAGRALFGLAVIHSSVPDEGAELLDRLCKQFDFTDKERSVCAGVSPVIGTHVGPGCLGVCYLTEE
jgi:fatty acid-binding protein DegV